MAKKNFFRKVENARFTIYWKKAQDFYQGMLKSYADKNWHSVGLESVHCAISATDAFLVYKRGLRSISKDHRDTVDLLINQINSKEVHKYADTLLKILDMKNHIEYEDRIFTEEESRRILKKTERYFNWVKQQLP